MDLDADAVPEAVREVVAVAGLGQHGRRDVVRLPAGHAGLDPFFGHRLRRQYGVVDAPELRVGLAGRDRPRQVRAVAVGPSRRGP